MHGKGLVFSVSVAIGLAGSVCLGMLAGCTDGRPKRVPVAGQVLIDGQPLTPKGPGYYYIRLVPADARPALGLIDSEGRFRLTTFEGEDGCTLGEHKVVVMAYEQIGPAACRWLVPKKYSDLRTTDKTVRITGPTKDLKIELSWEGGKPFIERFDLSGDSDPAKIR